MDEHVRKAPSLLDELAVVVRDIEVAESWDCTGDQMRCFDGSGCECAMRGCARPDVEGDAVDFIRTHHAEIADMAKIQSDQRSASGDAEEIAQWLYASGYREAAFTVRTQLDARNQHIADMAKRLEAAERDAARWRHARKLLTVDDIEGAQGSYDSFRRLVSENECKRADDAIDAAMQEGEG